MDALEVMVAHEAQSVITLKSDEVEEFWNPILQDNIDQFLQGLISVFQGPGIQVRPPQDPTFVPYFVEENIIDWRAPDLLSATTKDDDNIASNEVILPTSTHEAEIFADLISFESECWNNFVFSYAGSECGTISCSGKQLHKQVRAECSGFWGLHLHHFHQG